MKVELLISTRAELGEGINIFPNGNMRWVDLPHGVVYEWDGHENRTLYHRNFEISKILPWIHGSIILNHTAVILIDHEGDEVERIHLHDSSSNLRCSDGLVLPNGEIMVGILDRDLAPHRGRLIRIKRDRTIETIVENTSISNGITLLNGGHNIAWVDSPKKKIEVFDFDFQSGAIANQRDFASLEVQEGLIDGMCADAEGGIWAALWRGSGIAHFWPDGSFDRLISFASPNVTSCAFDREDNLMITTGTATLSDDELDAYPGAGGVWKISHQEHGTKRAPLNISTL